MSIFPVIGVNLDATNAIEINEKNEEVEIKELKFDFNLKRIIVEDGKLIIATFEERIKQWIELLIRTEFNKYKVYQGTKFGFDYLYKVRGHSFFSSFFSRSELERELREKIILNKEIINIKNLKISNDFNILKVDFEVVLANENNVSGVIEIE